MTSELKKTIAAMQSSAESDRNSRDLCRKAGQNVHAQMLHRGRALVDCLSIDRREKEQGFVVIFRNGEEVKRRD